MGLIVCFDSHVLCWAIKQEAESGQEEMIPRAIALIEQLDKKGAITIIPAVVLTEVLHPVPKEYRPPIAAKLYESFIIHPFDPRTAEICADILHSRFELAKEGYSNGIGRRSRMKYDAMIVATAVAGGAQVIYSEDPDLSLYADGYIRVEQIPEAYSQSTLDF